jgi:hypothetical protein
MAAHTAQQKADGLKAAQAHLPPNGWMGLRWMGLRLALSGQVVD